MAFRIHASVVRGEIDNRVKGVVKGRIWLAGRPDAVLLDLTGNACRDLAGCLLTFVNRHKPVPDPQLDLLHPLQRGSIGDLTASRKVRVLEVTVREARAMHRGKEKPPEHMANCLYLEWFSEANGRVVIESAAYQLTISPPEWQMSPEEESQRANQSKAGMTDFLDTLNEAIERAQRGHMSLKIVSGGQTGADRAALDWAINHGVPHGGWCPKGRKAEHGRIGDRYLLQETSLEDPAQRTEWNVRDSDGTLIISIQPVLTGGSHRTRELTHRYRKPLLHLCQRAQDEPAELLLRRFIREHGIHVLNIAGPRASDEPDLAKFVNEILEKTFAKARPAGP